MTKEEAVEKLYSVFDKKAHNYLKEHDFNEDELKGFQAGVEFLGSMLNDPDFTAVATEIEEAHLNIED